MSRNADLEAEKALAARRAVDEIRDGMRVGLGTGSTAAYAIREIAKRVMAGLKITAAATSHATQELASGLGIPVIPFEQLAQLDLTIDGADEVDPGLNAIKGGGGALLREKIVAAASDRMIVIVDSSKFVAQLGRFKLPVEVLPFACAFVERKILESFNIHAQKRMRPDVTPFLTDQQNYILDLHFGVIDNPAGLAAQLEAIPGIIEHGLFLTEVDEVFVGRQNHVEILTRRETK